MFQEQFFEEYVIGFTRQTMGRTITETDVVLHAGQTGDFYPHHMDAEWCKTQDFGQRMAHGTLIFSVAIGMTAGAINPRAMSYGYDRLRFIRPVFINDTIRVTASIAEKRDHPRRADSGIVVEKIEVVNQRDETVLVWRASVSGAASERIGIMNRPRWLILALVIVSIVLLLSCGLSAAAMQQGFVAPPEIKLELAGVRVISGISTLPDCARLLTPGCSSLHPEPTIWIYTVWLLWQRKPGLQESTHIFQLFSTRIKHP